MNTRRRIILKELGLTPLWRLRSKSRETRASPDTGLTKHTNQENVAIEQMNWAQLAATVADCQACSLRQSCSQTVFGVGDQNADWLFIGEAPGAREDALGEPFVGQAGKLLDNMLAAIQLKRGQNVYIANIVKCRPPNNRNPSVEEARQCEPYLARQISLIQPKLIIALGKVAAQNLLMSVDSIARLRGKIHSYSDVPLMVTYHPAYLLRALPEKAKAWQDLRAASDLMQSYQRENATTHITQI